MADYTLTPRTVQTTAPGFGVRLRFGGGTDWTDIISEGDLLRIYLPLALR